ncbi:hypothetical protein [Nocardioides sp. MH1]|uniref:AMIN-like domain-containing (lipo)protein n=1 Tax=Nocardioides sp. MH1 TaxID=3242490 RepID=UPI0035212316
MNLTTNPRRLAGAAALALALAATPAAALACGGGEGDGGAGGGMVDKQACSTPWGSLVKEGVRHHISKQVVDVRSGQHACFDRLVIDLGGDGSGTTGYRVEYVDHVVADGSGLRVPLRGRAQLQLVVDAPAYDAQGDPTFTPAHPRELVAVDGYRTFRQVRWVGTFEGQTAIGIGVRARLPVRAFVLDDASGRRLVIDVAHKWS